MNKTYRNFLYLGIIMFLAAMPNTMQGQNDNKVVNVNKLDVIYNDDDNEYPDATVDQSRDNNTTTVTPQAPLAVPSEDDRDLSNANRMYRPEQVGEGVDSEFDILYASMDYEVIHYASSSELPDSITIHLTDKNRGRKFCFPTPDHARLSSHFGARKRRWHYGVDLAMPTGEPIYAAFDGIVRISKFNKSYGNLVVVRHFNGLETYYAHMSQRDVKPGDTVRAGQVLGLCGNTGRSYGSHLHFEIRYMGKAMNPEYVVDCRTHQLLSDELLLTPAYFRKVGSSHSSPDMAELHRVNRHAGTAANDATTVAQNQKRTATTKPEPQNKTNQKASQKKSTAQYYTIRSGDTLGKIAKRYNTTVSKLCQLNGIKPNTTLKIGRRIRVK